MSAPSLAASAARVLLVRAPSNEVRGSGRDTVAPRDPNAPKVRRYRLARLQLNGRPTGRPTGRARYEHLQRSYD